MSAWATGQRLVLGQEAESDKSNEITAIPLLLMRLELAGALVTIGATGTQTAIAQAVLDRGGDHLLALKRNRPETFASVEELFAHLLPGPAVGAHQTVVGGHGRMVESTTERGGKTEHEVRCYLCSAKLDANTFARAARSHWKVENRLHWVLDAVLHDDLARLRTGYGPANMAVVKHMAPNLLTQARPTTSLKSRRKQAGWNTNYLAQVIQQTTWPLTRLPWRLRPDPLQSAKM